MQELLECKAKKCGRRCGVAGLALIWLPLTRAQEQTPTSRIVSAANTFPATLDQKQRQTVLFPIDDQEQRKRWSNFLSA